MGLFNLDYKIYCVQNLLEFLIIHQIVQIVLFEPLVLEFEVLFSALLPQIYVEVHVGASFVGVDYLLRFLVPGGVCIIGLNVNWLWSYHHFNPPQSYSQPYTI